MFKGNEPKWEPKKRGIEVQRTCDKQDQVKEFFALMPERRF